MTRQTDLGDFEGARVLTDGGEDDEEATPHFDADAETVTEAWTGAFLQVSWGYNQTNRSFAQIVDVSDTGKTVVCRLVRAERVSTEAGCENLRPSAKQYGDEFRLHVRSSGGDPAFRGSYPYVDGDEDNGTRRGWFYPVDNAEGRTYHQTAPGYRH